MVRARDTRRPVVVYVQTRKGNRSVVPRVKRNVFVLNRALPTDCLTMRRLERKTDGKYYYVQNKKKKNACRAQPVRNNE